MVDTSSSTPDELSAATALVDPGAGVDWAYDLLDQLGERYGLADAFLAVHPEPSALQLFRRGRRPIPPHRMTALASCPSGVVDARGLSLATLADGANGPDETTCAVLGTLCDAHYRALLAARSATVDPTTGLLSRHAIAAALNRAAACGARYGWSSTVVVLTTAGEAPAHRRWLALAGALRGLLRTGDEAGVLATGSALVLLGNVGPDAVRPFVARVRAALSAADHDGIDLFVATATTPRESVDPAQLRQLALERLEEMGAPAPAPSAARDIAELDVRSVPGVVWVAWGSGSAPHVTVGAWSAGEELEANVTRQVHEHFPEASVSVVDAGAAVLTHTHRQSGSDDLLLELRDNDEQRTSSGAPPLLSATAPASGRGPSGGDVPVGTIAPGTARVGLMRACFDAVLGETEVTLGRGDALCTSHAPAGPLIGGAQATIDALRALGEDVPFYLASADRVLGVPGAPVVVVLGPRHSARAGDAGSNERIGVASGNDDADAASRATLGALNRYLSRPRSS